MIQNDLYQFDDFELQPSRRLLLRGGTRVPIAPRTFQVLLCLVQRAGNVVRKEDLLELVWQESFVEQSNLTQHVFWLRKALTDRGNYIVTVPGVGYEFTGQVRVTLAQPIQPEDVTQPVAATGSDELPGAAPDAAVSAGFRDGLPFERTHISPTAGSLPHGRRLRRTALLGVASCFAAVAAIVVWWLVQPPPHWNVAAIKRLTSDGTAKDLRYDSILATDGENIFFAERRGNQNVFAKVPVKGGVVELLPAPFPDASIDDFSPSRQAILTGSDWHQNDDRPIMAGPVGGSLKQIGELTGHDAAWSPNGDHIAIAKNNYLYISNADGSNARQIVRADGQVYAPRWSPDGEWITFSRNLSGGIGTQLWLVQADGRNARELLPNSPDHNQMNTGVWSKDGRSIFYLSGGPTFSEIWTIQAHERRWDSNLPKPVQLTRGPVDLWRAPLPSTDGKHLWALGAQIQGELMRVDAQSRELKTFGGGVSAEGVDFSRDGFWMAYTAYPEGTLWRSHLDGSEKTQLTKPPMIARFPKWAPDGRNIIFLGARPDGKWKLYLLTVDTGGIRLLHEVEDANDGVANWSVDGKTVIYGRLVDLADGRNTGLTIESLNLASGLRTTLHGSSGLWTARWSPDGRFLTAVTQDNRSLRMFDFSSQRWTELANLKVNDVVWSPDSHYVYFDTVFGTDSKLFRVRIADRKLEQWADLKDFHRGGFFDPWLGMSPDGDPILLRDISVQEVYELSLEHAR